MLWLSSEKYLGEDKGEGYNKGIRNRGSKDSLKYLLFIKKQFFLFPVLSVLAVYILKGFLSKLL